MILCAQNAVNFVVKNKFYYLLKNFYGVEDNNSSTPFFVIYFLNLGKKKEKIKIFPYLYLK